MVDNKFALVYTAGNGPDKKETAKLTGLLKDANRSEFRNSKRFNFTKNDKGQVLQCDVEECDIVITDDPKVIEAYRHTAKYQPELRGLLKKLPDPPTEEASE